MLNDSNVEVMLRRMQERMLEIIRGEVQGWLDALLHDAFDPERFLRFIAVMGIDLSRISEMVGQPQGFDPYRVLGLEKTATDEEVK